MTFDIFLTLFLVLLNGFFVAAEFAIVKVRTSQISLQKGNYSKKAAEIILKNLDGYLAATQLGITLASLGLGWVGEEVVTEIILHVMSAFNVTIELATAHTIALPVAFFIITILHITFGELAPKSIAIRFPTPTTLALAVPLRIFYYIFKPFIVLLNGLAGFILRLIGIKPVSDNDIHSEEELKLIIAESEEGGAIEESERELIQNVFDFDDRIVRQIMVPRIKVSALSAHITVDDAMKMVLKEGYSRFPTFDGSLDEIVGMVYAKDIVLNYVEKTGKTLREISRPAYYITDNKSIDSLLREFQRKKVQMAIVISEFGGTLGVVTLEDILEELVGDIQDEHDHEQQIVTPTAPNTYEVLAKSSLHDINKVLDFPFTESEEYETLAGLILYNRSFDLKEGEEITIDNYAVRIMKMNKTLPELVEIKLIPRKE